LIEGDAEGNSDALLGIFDAIAPAASRRWRRWPKRPRDLPRYPRADRALSRHIFCAPTRYYKTAWCA